MLLLFALYRIGGVVWGQGDQFGPDMIRFGPGHD